MRHFALLTLTLAIFTSPLCAFAQEPGAPPAVATVSSSPPVPLPAGVPSLDDNALAFAGVLVQLAQAGQWGSFAALVVFALVWAVRRFAGHLPAGKVRDFLTGKWGGWLLNFGAAIAAGFATVALTGTPMGLVTVLGIIGGGVTYALGAAGLVELKKDVMPAPVPVTEKAEALRIMEQGPRP